MSKPDGIVSSSAAVSTESSSSSGKEEDNYQDAQLLLHAMKAAAVALPPTVVSPVASPTLSAAPSPTQTETELDLAACLVALSRSPSTTVSSSSASTVVVSSPNLAPPDPVRSSTTTSSKGNLPPLPTTATRRKSPRKTRVCNANNNKNKRYREEESPDSEEPSQKKPKNKTECTTTNDIWETRFQQLQRYKARFGHANPKSGKASKLPVARWLKDQRQLFRNDILDPTQVQRLKDLGCTGFDQEETYAAITCSSNSTSNNNPQLKAKKTTAACKKPEPSSSPATLKKDPPVPRPPGPCNIPEPTNNDVVFGRGASIYKLAGNVRFRSTVAKRKLEYIAKPDAEKMPIAVEVVEQIRGMGGRFLAKDAASGAWYDVGDKLALKKTSMTLRQDARAIREADAKGVPPAAAVTAATTKKRAPPSSTAGTAKTKKTATKDTTTAAKETAIAATTKKRAAPKKKKKRGPSWEERYTQLVDYKAATGDTHPPPHGALAEWLETQRQRFANGKLPKEESQSLRDLGCSGFGAEEENGSTIQSPSWDERYQQLKEHANSPRSMAPELAQWVTDQRDNFQRGTLSNDKAKMLQDLDCEGFGGTKEEEEQQQESEESSSPSTDKEKVSCATVGNQEERQQPRAARRPTRNRRMGVGAYRIMLLSGQRLNVTCK